MMGTQTLLALLAALATVAVGQDTKPCESYDVNTGSGVCNGMSVNIGNVICANGFDKAKCQASKNDNGRTETYFFKGTPSGLPAGPNIQSDCNSGDFPASGGIALAQAYENGAAPDGCFPAGDVSGTNMYYTPGSTSGTLASVTVEFAKHTDGTGVVRQGFIKITCQPGGPTSNFQYSTIGDDGHQSVYEIDTTADCAKSGSGGGGGGGKPDPNLCESYNVDTGSGICNGVNVDIGAVICADGFNKTMCQVSRIDSTNDRTETFFFRGTPTGLPAGPDIQSDCNSNDFPAGGGVALAQTFQTQASPPAMGCNPAGVVSGTSMYYTAGASNDTLASITVLFSVFEGEGVARRGFIKIACQTGGPTNNFQYTTVGDDGHLNVYEIDTTADCTKSGGGSDTPDSNLCESYDVKTGSGTCGGANINIGAVICAGGFKESACQASRNNNGRTETFLFRGTPTGLPAGPDIQSDCDAGDFPASGGVAMAQTFEMEKAPDGCYPTGDVSGTTMYYTPGDPSTTTPASVTVVFGKHTDGAGVSRQGFIKIICEDGGPTSDFPYSTSGDDGHANVYGVLAIADCIKSGGDGL